MSRGARGSLNSRFNKGPNPRCPECRNEMTALDRTQGDERGRGYATVWRCAACGFLSTVLP
jgi:uncharacterized protein with PIN domain